MNEKMYEKVNVKTAQKFNDAASWIVDHKCTTMDGGKITGDQRSNLVNVLSMDLELGSNSTKNKYLATGLVSGLIISSAVAVTYMIIKKRQNGGKPQKESK